MGDIHVKFLLTGSCWAFGDEDELCCNKVRYWKIINTSRVMGHYSFSRVGKREGLDLEFSIFVLYWLCILSGGLA
ncbi:hypothetical protein V6N13_006325 [Hibiscus sabdariffa]